MACGVHQISRIALSSAKAFLQQKRYGRAFANFLLYLKLEPEKKDDVLDDFVLTMRLWTDTLEKEGKIEELFKCYDLACEILPDCEEILNNIGAQLFRLGYAEEAALYIRRALQINPEYIHARENLENICSHLVERWHFRMLNDVKRNKMFREAIENASMSGFHTVLDIGSGTGILSLMAADAGAAEVTAVEKSKIMFDISQDVLRANNASDRVKLLCKHSTELLISEDIPDRVSLVVTETFDAGLFGEHIISTLQHAWKELLIPSSSARKAKVIPNGATIHVCAIECESIREQNRFLYPGLHHLDIGDIEITCTTGNTEEEPYTTENLSRIRQGYTRLSESSVLTKVNFCDPLEISILDSGIDWHANIPITKAGKLDAIVVWFELHLDKNLSISTSPLTENCWEQAIFPTLQRHFVSANSYSQANNGWCIMHEGDLLHVKFSLKDDCFKLISCDCSSEDIIDILSSSLHTNHIPNLVVPRPSSKDYSMTNGHTPGCQSLPYAFRRRSPINVPMHMPSENPMYLETRSVEKFPVLNMEQEEAVNLSIGSASYSFPQGPGAMACYYLERTEMQRLNNLNYNRFYVQALKKFLSYKNGHDACGLIDFCGGLSLVTIQMLKSGFSFGTVVVREGLIPLIKDLRLLNGVNNLNIVEQQDLNDMDSTVGFDVMICDIVEPCGILKQQILEDIALLRATCLNSDAIIIPGKVTVHGLCIESDMLLKECCVISNEHTLGYDIAKFINDFQMTNHVDIDLTTLMHKRLADPFPLLTFDLNESISLDSPPSFLEQSSEIKVPMTDYGFLSAVLYWFEFESPLGPSFSTLDLTLPWKQAAVMIKYPHEIMEGQVIKFKVSLKNSCLSIKLVD